jgi:hypothetical protein
MKSASLDFRMVTQDIRKDDYLGICAASLNSSLDSIQLFDSRDDIADLGSAEDVLQFEFCV